MPQLSMTQDLDPRFSVFLNPIRDLTKNWEVDIAKYLEEYLEELSEVQITFNGGETVMNFAQAAMLIQGSATVYSKKVEFLWQMVLQMLELLSSRQSGKDVGGGVGKEGGGGGGKAALNSSLAFTSADDISRGGRSIDLKDDNEDDDRKKTLRLLPATPLHLVEKEGEKAKKRVALVVRGREVFGAKDDFRLNRSYLSSRGSLCMEVPAEILRGGVVEPEQSIVEDDEGERDGDGSSDPPAATTDTEPPPPTDVVPPPSNTTEPTADAVPPKEDIPGQPPPEDDNDDGPPDLDFPEPDHMSVDGDLGDKDEEKKDKSKDDPPNNNNNNSNKDQDVIDLPNGRYGLRRRGDKKEAIVTLKLTDMLKPVDPHAETPAKRPIRKARLRRPPACACHRPNRTMERRKDRERKDAGNNKGNNKTLPPVESFIMGELAAKLGTNTTNNKEKVPSSLLTEVKSETTKRVETDRDKRIRKLLKARTGGGNMAEAIQKVNEETQLQNNMDQQLDDHFNNDDGAADLDCDGDLPVPPLFLPEPHNATQMPESINKRFADSQYDEPATDYEALVQKWVSDYISTAQEQVNSSDLTRRVNKWRDNITPKLEEEEGRQEFDIHSYGSQVLSHFPDNGRKQTVAFSSVAHGQDPREASRLFLSCLMLANTHNLELSESIPGDMAMDCLELTLLSRVRHHEELQDYYAPSQNTASPRRKSGNGSSGSGSSAGRVNPGANICADITQSALAEHNLLGAANSRARPKAKTRHR